MNLRHFENKARQSFWRVHIEAWRQSGLTRTAYCRQHRLHRTTFKHWLEYLAGKEDARKHMEYQAELRREERRNAPKRKPRRRQKGRFGANTDVRCRALQAFWAMHVEALTWSGMSVGDYAGALSLSPHALRRWRDRFDDGEVEIDWRAQLHPSARPCVSTITNGAAMTGLLTNAGEPDPSSRPSRRYFTDDHKRAIVQESEAPGTTVSAVARRHGVSTGLLFRWRSEFGAAPKSRARLASVTLDDQTGTVLLPNNLVRPPDGMMAIDLPDGQRVFVPEGIDLDTVRKQATRGENAS